MSLEEGRKVARSILAASLVALVLFAGAVVSLYGWLLMTGGLDDGGVHVADAVKLNLALTGALIVVVFAAMTYQARFFARLHRETGEVGALARGQAESLEHVAKRLSEAESALERLRGPPASQEKKR